MREVVHRIQHHALLCRNSDARERGRKSIVFRARNEKEKKLQAKNMLGQALDQKSTLVGTHALARHRKTSGQSGDMAAKRGGKRCRKPDALAPIP